MIALHRDVGVDAIGVNVSHEVAKKKVDAPFRNGFLWFESDTAVTLHIINIGIETDRNPNESEIIWTIWIVFFLGDLISFNLYFLIKWEKWHSRQQS